MPAAHNEDITHPQPASTALSPAFRAELAAIVMHLGHLRLIEGGGRCWVVRAGVGHCVAQPERIESITNVVMVMERRLKVFITSTKAFTRYLSCMSLVTDFTPSTALATRTAPLISARELTKPLN